MLTIFEPLLFAFDGSKVNLAIAFLSGIASFFASCLLPLVPTYLAYLSGISLQDKHFTKKQRLRIFTTGLSFVLGFIVVFVILGLSLHHFSSYLTPYRLLLQKIAGLLFIALGLLILGLIKPGLLIREHRLPLQKILTKYHLLHAFITGGAFAVSWSPCIGPILAVILFWASQTATSMHGFVLLLAFALGLGLPFLVIAGSFQWLLPLVRKYKRLTHYLSIASAVIIIAVGILLVVGQFQNASSMLLRFFNTHFGSL